MGTRETYGSQYLRDVFGNDINITSTYRGPSHPLSVANPNSWHTKSHGAVDILPIPGMSFNEAVNRIRSGGYNLVEAIDETGSGKSGHATGDHWHFALQELGPGQKPKKSGGGILGDAISAVSRIGRGLVKCGPNPACLAAETASQVLEETTGGSGGCGLNPVCYLREWWDEINFADRITLFIIGAILIIAGLGIFVLQSGPTKQIMQAIK